MNLTFRTSPPANYIPPGIEEMRETAKKVGLKGFAKDLVADLCNLAAGGKINPPSGYFDTLRRRVEEILPQPDSAGWWSVPVRVDGRKSVSTVEHRAEAVTALAQEQARYHQNVQDFLGAVDLGQFPGASPLEQAMSLLKLLATQQGGQSNGETGEPLPIFTDAERPEGVAEKLRDTMELVDELSEDEQDMLDPDGKNHELPSPEGDGERSGTKPLNRLAVAEDIAPGSNHRAMLDISRTLDQFTKLQLRKQEKLEADPAGEEIRQRPIKHLGELSRVSPTSWATRQQSSGYFLYQAVTGQLPVRERVTRVVRKQAVFILVDGSGSMNGRKHWKATGVVMNRLKAVLAGDAEVFVSVFDTKLQRVERATNAVEARALIKKFAAGNFTGGGTDIAASVKAAHGYVAEEIKKGAMLYRSEIVVLTDEDSSVTAVTSRDIPGTRVHGFAMEVANPSLVKFAQSTGGVGVDKF